MKNSFDDAKRKRLQNNFFVCFFLLETPRAPGQRTPMPERVSGGAKDQKGREVKSMERSKNKQKNLKINPATNRKPVKRC